MCAFKSYCQKICLHICYLRHQFTFRRSSFILRSFIIKSLKVTMCISYQENKFSYVQTWKTCFRQLRHTAHAWILMLWRDGSGFIITQVLSLESSIEHSLTEACSLANERQRKRVEKNLSLTPWKTQNLIMKDIGYKNLILSPCSWSIYLLLSLCLMLTLRCSKDLQFCHLPVGCDVALKTAPTLALPWWACVCCLFSRHFLKSYMNTFFPKLKRKRVEEKQNSWRTVLEG